MKNGFRLREKLSDKLTQVYADEKILSSYSMHDDKEIAIQLGSQKEDETDSKHLIMVKHWNPDTWTLDAPQEIYLSKNANLGDFATALQNIYPDLK